MSTPIPPLPPFGHMMVPRGEHPASENFAPNGALNDIDARLILELVAKIDPVAQILERYGLTKEELQTKLGSPIFKSAFLEASRAWKSNPNMKERIRMKAGALLEDTLQDIFMIIRNGQLPASQRLEGTKQLASLAGLAQQKEGVVAASTFTLNIIRRGRDPVTINAATEPTLQLPE